MSSLPPEYSIKMKLAQSYQDDLVAQKAKFDLEKQKRIEQEQAELQKVQEELAKENQTLQERKRQIASLQYSDYMASLEAKRLKELHQYENKLHGENVSLPMNSEERLKKHKDYIASLSDKVDVNGRSYIDYNERNKQAKYFNPLTQKYTTVKQVTDTFPVDNNYNKYPGNVPLNGQTYLNERNYNILLPMSQQKIDSYHNNTNTGVNNGNVNNNNNNNLNHNNTYIDYKNVSKEYDDYNRNLVSQNLKYKQEMFFKRKEEEEARRKELERLEYLRQEEKMFENQKKKQYREFLDLQMQEKVPVKLNNESYALNAALAVNNYKDDNLYKYAPDNSFVNKNKFVEVNPCKFYFI